MQTLLIGGLLFGPMGAFALAVVLLAQAAHRRIGESEDKRRQEQVQ